MVSNDDAGGNTNEQPKKDGEGQSFRSSATFDNGFELPRTISPIGIFFGKGATDPRRAKKEGDESSSEGGAAAEQPKTRRRGRDPIGTPLTRTLISLGVTVGCGLFYKIIMNLPLDPSRLEFWVFLVWLVIVYTACMLFLRGTKDRRSNKVQKTGEK